MDRHMGSGSSNPYYGDMMSDLIKAGPEPGMSQMHNSVPGSAASQPDMSAFASSIPQGNSGLDAAWALANLPEVPGLDKQILAQALMSQASTALLNAELATSKDKLIDSLMRLSEKVQQDREGGASGPGGNHHGNNGGGGNGSLVQPIRVMTQQNSASGSYHSGGAASVNTWSNPSTPNSGADSSAPSGPEQQQQQQQQHGGSSMPIPGQHRPGVHHMFPQKNFPNKFSPQQNGRGNGGNIHSPIPAGFEKRPGSSGGGGGGSGGFPGGPSPPGPGGFRGGRGMPFPFPRQQQQRHVCDPSGDAKPGSDRFPSGPFPLPEHLSMLERGPGPFPKEFPGLPHHHRSHFIEDLFPHEYGGMPPFPSHLKYPHNLPPHLPPEAYEYFPYDPYFQGCLAPTFFGPNDMFFDMLPPHFYGLPHFFPGFKPPR